MNSGNGIHILPVMVMVIGMLMVGAGIIGEFDGSRRLPGNGRLLLGLVGVALLIGGAWLL